MCVCFCVCGGGDSGIINFYTGCRKTNVCVCVFEELVIVAVLIFTQGAGKLMCVCVCVCRGGDSGSNNCYIGCSKTNVCVSMCL
jgi:hypothetical protein